MQTNFPVAGGTWAILSSLGILMGLVTRHPLPVIAAVPTTLACGMAVEERQRNRISLKESQSRENIQSLRTVLQAELAQMRAMAAADIRSLQTQLAQTQAMVEEASATAQAALSASQISSPLAPLKQALQGHTRKLKELELRQADFASRQEQALQTLSQGQQQISHALNCVRTQLAARPGQGVLWTDDNQQPLPAKVVTRPAVHRVMVFIDGSNINASARDQGRNVSYPDLLAKLCRGSQVEDVHYFGGMVKGNSRVERRHEALRQQGLTVHVREEQKGQANQDVAIALDMVRLSPQYDTAILLSGDGDFAQAIATLRQLGKRVEVASFRAHTHRDLCRFPDRYTDLTAWCPLPTTPLPTTTC